MRFLRNMIIALVVFSAAAAVAAAFGIPADFLAPTIEKQVGAETGYRVSIDGSTRIELWPSLNLQVGKVAFIDASDRSRQRRLTAEKVLVEVDASTLLSGRPKLTEIIIERPTYYVPLTRERAAEPAASAAPAHATPASEPAPVSVNRIVVTGGAIVFSDEKDAYESRLDHVEITGTLTGPDDALVVMATARAGEQLLGLSLKGKVPGQRIEGRTIPLAFTFEAPGQLEQLVSGVAETRTKGSLFSINSLSGTIGSNKFSGWASVDFASKPLVKMDVDFQRLDIAVAQQAPPPEAGADQTPPLDRPWSDEALSLVGLNFFDAEIQLSSSELRYSRFHFAPISVAAVLTNGVLTSAITRTGAYGGQIQGTLGIDAAGAVPSHALRVDLIGMQALPFLSDVADFPYLDARMVTRIDVRGRGASEKAIMSSLVGAIDVQFRNGEIRDVNVAQMIRALTSSILKGWEEKKTQKTDLSQLDAFFRIDGGRATTDNLNLVGPLVRVNGTGIADIGAKTLDFRLNPKLVLSLEGQGFSTGANPVGFGVPVAVRGSWGSPRFYPEVSGILDNPDAAYDKLRELGAGLFGSGSGKSGAAGNPSPIIPGLDSLLGSKNSATPAPAAPAQAREPPSQEPPSQGPPSQGPPSQEQLRPQQQAQPQEPAQQQAAPPPAASEAPAAQSQPGQSQAAPVPKKRDTETQIRDMLRDLFKQ